MSPASVGSVKSGARRPSSTKATSKRVVGVVRVSRVGGRDGEQFVSPSDQSERIRAACERDGFVLVKVFEELDVSGGAPLEQRHGLLPAVQMVEAGEAEVVMVAFFDRLVRSLSVQEEVSRRVEEAGGTIMALDVGEVRGDTAARKVTSQMLGMLAEYQRNSTAERTAEAKQRAVARGVAPFPNLPPGYRRGEDKRTEVDRVQAPIVAEAFRLRAAGATVMEVRDYLRENGIERTFHGTTSLLKSRFVLGELPFGEFFNPTAHPAIVDVATFQAVQRMRVSRGRRAKSERLLARLGVLRCGTCGSRMSVGSTGKKGQRYYMYRCPPVGDCPQRVTISAPEVEKAVTAAVQKLLGDLHGSAADDVGISEAVDELSRTKQALDAAVQTFTGMEDVPSTREKLHELRDARDAAQSRVDDLRAAMVPSITVRAGDWDLLNLEERRALIRAVIERVEIAPGREPERISIEPRRK